MKVLVFGVIYNGVKEFLGDYFNSVFSQTYKEFDVLIAEDGVDLPEEFKRENVFTIKSKNKTPAEIRSEGINYAQSNNYDIMVFTDCDDYFSSNRVKQAVKSLKHCDFVINNLLPIDVNGNIINVGSLTDNIPKEVLCTDIFHANWFGLSNTAMKISCLPTDFYIPSQLIAVDWWIFSLLLLNGNNFSYDSSVITYYRQHEKNTVGAFNSLDESKLMNGIKVKKCIIKIY